MGAGPVITARTCARCGAGADADARYCARCGAETASPAGPPPDGRASPDEHGASPGPPPPITLAPSPPAPVAGPARPAPTQGVTPGVVAGARPATEPSAIGRRASPLGWIGVVLAAGGFLAASIGVIALAGRGSVPSDRPGGGGAPAAGPPVARFDEGLYDGATVTEDEPFEIEVEAVNPAGAATERLWLIVDWHPADLPVMAGARGSFRSCDPARCAVREEPDGSRTVVSWPGLAAGERRVLRVTVAASGLEPGGDLWYRVRTGSGPSETALDGISVWDLTLEVE